MVERRPRRDRQRRVVHPGRHRADVGVLSPLAALLGRRRSGHAHREVAEPRSGRCARAVRPPTRPRCASTATSRPPSRSARRRAPPRSSTTTARASCCSSRTWRLPSRVTRSPAARSSRRATRSSNLAGLHGPRWCDESLHAIPGLGAVRCTTTPQGMRDRFGMMVEPFIERFEHARRRCRRAAHVRRRTSRLDVGRPRSLRARARRLPPRQPHVRDAGRRAAVHRGRLAARRRRSPCARPRFLPRHRLERRRARGHERGPRRRATTTRSSGTASAEYSLGAVSGRLPVRACSRVR